MNRKPLLWTTIVLLTAVVIMMFVLLSGSTDQHELHDEHETLHHHEAHLDLLVELEIVKWKGMRKAVDDQSKRPDLHVYEARVLKVWDGGATALDSIELWYPDFSELDGYDTKIVLPLPGETYEMKLYARPEEGKSIFEALRVAEEVRSIDVDKRLANGKAEVQVFSQTQTGVVLGIEKSHKQGLSMVYVASGMPANEVIASMSLKEAWDIARKNRAEVVKYGIGAPMLQQLPTGREVRISSNCNEQEDSNPPIRCVEEITLLNSNDVSRDRMLQKVYSKASKWSAKDAR